MYQDLIHRMRTQRWSFESLHQDFTDALLNKADQSLIDLSITGLAIHYFFKDLTLPMTALWRSQDLTILNAENMSDVDVETWQLLINKLAYKGEQQGALHAFDDNSITERLHIACEKIKRHWPAAYQNFRKSVPYICPIKNTTFCSTSTPKHFGVLFINSDQIDDDEELEITLIHEMAHQELFLINTRDPLINPRYKHHMLHAKFQGYNRPPIGRLHSTHALFRMLQYARIIRSKYQDAIVRDFSEAMNTLLHEELSDFGQQLYDEVYRDALGET